MRLWPCLLPLLLLTPASHAAAPPAPPAPVFSVPIACTIGVDCQIQNYMDRDPGPGAKDYHCGTRTYQDHGGLDLRLPNMAAEQAGVNVLAAASGKVLRLRDGVADVSVREIGQAAIKDELCGNGVVIGHPGGWESQYCHMKRGSVKVRVGQSVVAGDVLGQVGLSGDTEFPHLHFQVRHGDQTVDPFAPDVGKAASCGGGASMWSSAAAKALVYHDLSVLNFGFAGSPVTMEDIEAGQLATPTAASTAMLAYVRAIGLKKGDVQTISVAGPGGLDLGRNQVAPLNADKAQYMLFSGKRLTRTAWPNGIYRAEYEVRRGGQIVLKKTFEIRLK